MDEINRDTLVRLELSKYPLVGDGDDWHTGFNNSGDQLLVVPQLPIVIVLSFNAAGDLQETFHVPGFPSSSEFMFSNDDDKTLQDWLDQVGFRAGLIRVKRFHLENYHIYIADLPDTYCEMLRAQSKHFPEDIEHIYREIDRWSKEGLFVFRINKNRDFWIDATGQVRGS